jgi:serine/threonine protein kinase/Flp pilus assembly protein TadD
MAGERNRRGPEIGAVSGDAARLQRLRAIFDAVIDLPPGERPAALDRLTNGDVPLRREVEAVILRSEGTAAALESPLVGVSEVTAPSLVGERIGPYTVVRLIGMGGMGAVYEAIRADDQYRKRVAIKIVQRDIDSELTLARFRRERQILASLEHPNIAALHDGGVMADGRPFLVMEYIDGAPITTWCNARLLPLRDRVALFRQVCAAVHHAHKNLVIHRDLKPGNILVTGDGTAKLLDFGIAKLLEADDEIGAEPAMPLTRGGARAFTPEYASPEQLRGDTLSTAADVYSLGVILFELLTGRRPYQPKSRALVDLERAVLDTPVPRPSAVITDQASRALGGQSTARVRQRLHGELDSITLKALQMEPGRRYPSVEAFGDDLHNYLDGLPVRAQPDSIVYRARKFILRNKVATAASMLATAALLAGVIVAVGAARRAQAERVKAEQANDFLRQLLASVQPETGSRDARVSDVLTVAARRIEQEFATQPGLRADLETVIGQSYEGLGRYDEAGRQLRSSLRLREQSSGPRSAAVVTGLSNLGQLYLAQGMLDSAEQLFHRALALQDARSSTPDSLRASLLSDLGSLAHSQGRIAEAERLHRESYQAKRALFGAGSDVAALALNNVAVEVGDQGRLAEAESLHRQALATVNANNSRPNERAASILSDLAVVLDFEGKAAAADSAYIGALTLRRQLLGPDHPDYALALYNYSSFVFDQKRFADAADLARQILALRGKTLAESHPAVAGALQTLGKSLDQLGRRDSAEQALRESLALRQKYLEPGSWMIASSEGVLGEHYTAAKDFARAEQHIVHAEREFVQALGERNPRTVTNTRRLVALYTAWGKRDKATEWTAKLPDRR